MEASLPRGAFENTEVAFAMKSNRSLKESHRMFTLMNRRSLVQIGSRVTSLALKWRLPVVPIIRPTLFEQFCGGETLDETKKVVRELGSYGIDTFLDYGVEAKEGEGEFDKTVLHVIKALDHAEEDANVPVATTKVSGLARLELLEKINESVPLSNQEEEEVKQLRSRIGQIGEAAERTKMAIYFDAEESWIQDALDGLVEEVMSRHNHTQPLIFNTIQFYRHGRLDYLKACHQRAKAKGYILAIKLVRGAYLEKENRRAEREDYISPIQANKEFTDRDFNASLKYCVENIDDIAFCCASHNEESTYYLCELIDQYPKIRINHPHIYFSQLYGMSDHITFNLAEAGYNVAKYVPYGPVKDVVPYLIRRAQENSSVQGQVSRELKLLKKEMKRRNL